MRIENKYKIHALDTVNNPSEYCNCKFYSSKLEALKKATEYARKGAAMVIYEAICIVEEEPKPIRITEVK
jgi:hypothetical protein